MKVPLNIRLDRELADWIKAQAKAENRTVTNWIDTLIRQHREDLDSRNSDPCKGPGIG